MILIAAAKPVFLCFAAALLIHTAKTNIHTGTSCKPSKKDYNRSMKRTNLQTNVTLSLLLGISLLSLTGCQSFPDSAEPETNVQSPAEEAPVELTLLTTP